MVAEGTGLCGVYIGGDRGGAKRHAKGKGQALEACVCLSMRGTQGQENFAQSKAAGRLAKGEAIRGEFYSNENKQTVGASMKLRRCHLAPRRLIYLFLRGNSNSNQELLP